MIPQRYPILRSFRVRTSADRFNCPVPGQWKEVSIPAGSSTDAPQNSENLILLGTYEVVPGEVLSLVQRNRIISFVPFQSEVALPASHLFAGCFRILGETFLVTLAPQVEEVSSSDRVMIYFDRVVASEDSELILPAEEKFLGSWFDPTGTYVITTRKEE